jgi:hypothetical protein
MAGLLSTWLVVVVVAVLRSVCQFVIAVGHCVSVAWRHSVRTLGVFVRVRPVESAVGWFARFARLARFHWFARSLVAGLLHWFIASGWSRHWLAGCSVVTACWLVAGWLVCFAVIARLLGCLHWLSARLVGSSVSLVVVIAAVSLARFACQLVCCLLVIACSLARWLACRLLSVAVSWLVVVIIAGWLRCFVIVCLLGCQFVVIVCSVSRRCHCRFGCHWLSVTVCLVARHCRFRCRLPSGCRLSLPLLACLPLSCPLVGLAVSWLLVSLAVIVGLPLVRHWSSFGSPFAVIRCRSVAWLGCRLARRHCHRQLNARPARFGWLFARSVGLPGCQFVSSSLFAVWLVGHCWSFARLLACWSVCHCLSCSALAACSLALLFAHCLPAKSAPDQCAQRIRLMRSAVQLHWRTLPQKASDALPQMHLTRAVMVMPSRRTERHQALPRCLAGHSAYMVTKVCAISAQLLLQHCCRNIPSAGNPWTVAAADKQIRNV